MHLELAIAIAAAAAFAQGCSTLAHDVCTPGEQAAVTETLYFGTATPQGIVTDDTWATFLREVVTPRLW